MYTVAPLFKSHFSLGKSILTLEKPSDDSEYPISLFQLAKKNKLDKVILVEDGISGLLQASKVAEEIKVTLIYGLRIDVCDDMSIKDEPSLTKRAKYIIFAKNPKGYQALLKVWSKAASEGHYYEPNIDFKTLKSIWTNDLVLAIPFYDSFLYLNTFCSHVHVPALEGFGPITFFVEDNNLPFDDALKARVIEYTTQNGYPIIPAQSIFYKSAEDYLAYVAFKCLHNKGFTRKATLESPNLDHMTSDEFNFDKWYATVQK